jgi:predicted HicB family RNase H-like nuclease
MTKINLQGNISVGPYKGYSGRAEYDDEANAFHGEVMGTRAVIHFSGRTPDELSKAFAESVDDYLAFCAADGEPPEKPFSGKFLVRIKPQTHRNLVALAEQTARSLNQLVSDCLDNAISTHSEADQSALEHGSKPAISASTGSLRERSDKRRGLAKRTIKKRSAVKSAKRAVSNSSSRRRSRPTSG